MPPATPEFASKLRELPSPAHAPVRLHVSRSAARALRSGDPWLPVEKISAQNREGSAGDIAVAVDGDRRFAAVGLYDPHSPIRMRALHARSPQTIDRAFFAERLAASVARREPLRSSEATTGYRLVHGESDGLPGLVVDRYDRTLVVKLYSHAWVPHLPSVVDALIGPAEADAVCLRLSRALRDEPAALHGLRDGTWIAGSPPPGPLRFRENGLVFEVDPVRGQKTGFFLDQRDNRERCEALARGLRVLNTFAYSGGFSLSCARGGAREVWSLDQSGAALASARANFDANSDAVAGTVHRCVEADAFERLRALARDGERFGMVILDPPAFAHRRTQVPRALEAYGRLVKLGLGVLEPGGQLVAASCSRAVAADDFGRAVEQAAHECRRPLQRPEWTAQPLDHPTDFAAGRYLKCVFARA